MVDDRALLKKLKDFYDKTPIKEEDLVKVAIIGSRRYSNTRKIKDTIAMLKEKFDNRLVIVSGGQPQGADGFAKKWAISLNVRYVEFPPAHYKWNQYCIKEPKNYNLPYRVWNFHNRNTEIVEYADFVLCFIPPDMENIKESKGTYDAYKKATKLNKETKIIS